MAVARAIFPSTQRVVFNFCSVLVMKFIRKNTLYCCHLMNFLQIYNHFFRRGWGSCKRHDWWLFDHQTNWCWGKNLQFSYGHRTKIYSQGILSGFHERQKIQRRFYSLFFTIYVVEAYFKTYVNYFKISIHFCCKICKYFCHWNIQIIHFYNILRLRLGYY